MISPSDVTAIVLAAGLSRRHLDSDKLLRNLHDKPLAMHIADSLKAIPFQDRIAIVAKDNSELAGLFSERRFTVTPNSEPSRGQGHSLALGVKCALMGKPPKALLICLADMPYIPPDVIERLIQGLNSGATAAICSTDDQVSPPALFSTSHFDDLAHLEGERGAKTLLQDIPDLLKVKVAPHHLRDFDTEQDFLSPY